MEASGLSFRRLPPEIVRLVMEHLNTDDTTSLRAAILVNRTWAVEGISVLWQLLHMKAFTAIPSGRRQYYASQIRTLIVRGPMAQHEIFRFLQFPKLRCAVLELVEDGHNSNGKGISVDHYLQSSLEGFSLRGCVLAEDAFGLLESQCPRLRIIEIESMPDIKPTRLLRFLEACRSLAIIGFHWEETNEEPIDDQVFAHLAGRDGLAGLRLSRLIKYEKVRKAFQAIQSPPFKNIYRLDAQLQSKAVAPLVAATSSVARLSLIIQDNDAMFLSMISSRVGLIELEIVFLRDVELLGTDLLALGGLTNLINLSILAPDTEVTRSTFSDDQFHQLVAGMANLKYLTLQVEFELSMDSIIAVGTHCRQLRFCEIWGAQINLFELALIQSPLFPALEYVQLDATATAIAAER